MDLATVVMILQLIGQGTPEFIAIYDRITAALGTDKTADLDKLLAEADAAADAQFAEGQAL